MSELFSGYRERRTGNAAGQEIYSTKIGAIDFCNGALNYLPLRPILPEGIASVAINLNRCREFETGRFKASRLPSRSRANLQNSQDPPPGRSIRLESNRVASHFP